jgi:hypothetical protein
MYTGRHKQDMRIRATLQRAFWSPLCAAVGWVGDIYTLHARATIPMTRDVARRAEYHGLPCLILTSNVSVLDPSTAWCTPFSATHFTEQELNFVTADVIRLSLQSLPFSSSVLAT